MREHLKDAHQWQSGSKGGRPKKSPGSTKSVARELWAKVTIERGLNDVGAEYRVVDESGISGDEMGGGGKKELGYFTFMHDLLAHAVVSCALLFLGSG